MIKKLLIIFSLFFTSYALADIYVVYLNGIANNITDAESSRVKLCESLKFFAPLSKKSEGCEANSENVKYVRMYNPTNGSYDKAELAWQAAFSDHALYQTKLIYPAATINELIQKTEYIKYLGDLYDSKISALKSSGKYRDWDSIKDENEANKGVVFEAADTYADKLIEKSNQGHKIIVVSHSQGNFFAEAAYALILKRNPESLKKIKFVGVASVAASTPNVTRYVSSKDDSAVFTAQPANYASVRPIIRLTDPALILNGIYEPKAPNVETDSFDVVGHNFSTVYMGDEVKDKATKILVKSIIANHIIDAYNEIDGASTDYVRHTISGTSIDPSIALFAGAGAGGLSNAQLAPNDAGVAYGYANYTQGGQTKFGVFFLNQPGGSWYLATDSSQAYTSSSLVGVNDLGQAIIQDTDTRTLPAVTRYSYVSKANDGSLFRLPLNVPSGVTLKGILNNGNIVGVKEYDTILYDKTMNPISTIYGNVFLRFGLDGTSDASGYDTTAEVYKRVRFADGTVQTLPCNSGWTNLALLKPATGRNCSQITALSGNGVVAGLYYSADGSQGVYKFSKAGFEEIPISTQYFGYGTGANVFSPPRPLGVSNAGDILLSPIYSDENAQTCVGGPFLLSGSTLIDLKKYIPGGSCFNIQASISGGGRIFVSSQAQGYSGYLVKN